MISGCCTSRADTETIRLRRSSFVVVCVGILSLFLAGCHNTTDIATELKYDTRLAQFESVMPGLDQGNDGFAIKNGSHDLYIAEASNNTVISYSPDTVGLNKSTTVAGNGEPNAPTRVAVDASGNQYIVDSGNNRIRKVSHTDETISTVAELKGMQDDADAQAEKRSPRHRSRSKYRIRWMSRLERAAPISA